MQYTKNGGRAVAMAMLPPPPTKPITLPWQCGFSGEEKNKSMLTTVGEERRGEERSELKKGRGVSYRKIGLTTVAVTQDLHSRMPLVLYEKELIRLWNSILPEPGQPSVQLSKLIRLTACKNTKHAVSRWHRTVYIPWLVASYYAHKGKRWLHFNPPSHRGRSNEMIDPTTQQLIGETCTCRYSTTSATGWLIHPGLSLLEGWDAVPWSCWGKLQKGRNYRKERRTCFVYALRVSVFDDCVSVIWLDMTTPTWWRVKVMVYYYQYFYNYINSHELPGHERTFMYQKYFTPSGNTLSVLFCLTNDGLNCSLYFRGTAFI